MEINKKFYMKVLDNLYDGIYFLDRDKKIMYWNTGAEKHTGYMESEVIGRQCRDIFMHVNHEGVRLCNGACPIALTIAKGCLNEDNVYLRHKDGHLVPVIMRIAPIQDLNNQVVVAVEICDENSPRLMLHEKIKELRSLALIDTLTETGNRRYVEMNLIGKLEELRRYDRSFAVLFIDIDHFKIINDNYGHDIGDKMLSAVSKTLSNGLRPFDIFGRWGGEEFVALLVNLNEEHLYSVSERLRLLVEQLVISVNSIDVRATVSIGATLARKNDNINIIIKRADQLMYKSKVSGRNCTTTDEVRQCLASI